MGTRSVPPFLTREKMYAESCIAFGGGGKDWEEGTENEKKREKNDTIPVPVPIFRSILMGMQLKLHSTLFTLLPFSGVPCKRGGGGDRGGRGFGKHYDTRTHFAQHARHFGSVSLSDAHFIEFRFPAVFPILRKPHRASRGFFQFCSNCSFFPFPLLSSNNSILMIQCTPATHFPPRTSVPTFTS